MSNPTSLTDSVLFGKNLLFYIIETVNLSQRTRELTIEFLSSRLNVKPYNKLSKEAGDFKDLCDEHIYT